MYNKIYEDTRSITRIKFDIQVFGNLNCLLVQRTDILWALFSFLGTYIDEKDACVKNYFSR